MATKKTPDSNTESTAKKTVKKTGSTSAKAAKPKTTRTTRAKADMVEEKMDSMAGKAKSVARKMAGAVKTKAKDIVEKMGADDKETPTKRKTAVKRTITTKTSPSQKTAAGARAKSADKSTTSQARTKVGAMADDTTSKDVNAGISDMPTSDTIPRESDIDPESATDVKEHFFNDQNIHNGPPPAQPGRDLPEEYGDTKLCLLIRDPEWIYAYWEINDETRNELKLPRDGDTKRHVVRVYKVTGRNWPTESAHYFFDVDVDAGATGWYVHLPEPDEVWCAELGVFDAQNNYTSVCRSNLVSTPRNSISDAVDSEWMTVEESFEKITRLSGSALETHLRGDTKTASESILRTIHRQITGLLPGDHSGLNSGIFSSEALVRGDKDFWLRVHTELVLYGATEPNARVTVQGREITLNDDGTFSMRFALPDGEQVLEVRAVNADGDREETITPVVERTTR